MAVLLWPIFFAFFAHGAVAQFLNPPNANTIGEVSSLHLTEGSVVLISWDLPSDATQAQSKLYLWLDPGDGGYILTSNTTLDHFNWTVSAYGTNLSAVSTFHLTLYAEDKPATAGQGYFTSVIFTIVNAPTSSSSSSSSSTPIPTSTPIASSATKNSSPIIATTTPTPTPQPSPSQTSAATNAGLTTPTKIGLGVGIGLGVIVLAAIGFIFGKHYQKSLATKAGTAAKMGEPYTQYYEPAELPDPQHKQPIAQHSPVVEMPVNHSLLLTHELPSA